MGTEPSARLRIAIVLIAVSGVVALGAWLGLVVCFPRLGSSFDEQLPGVRADHLVVQQLRGVLGPRWELQMQVGYDEDSRIRWSTPLPRGARDVVVTDAIGILRTPIDPEGSEPRLEAYAYDDGALAWSLSDEHAVGRPWLAEAQGLLLEALSDPPRLRGIELATGRVRWEVTDAALTRAPADGWHVRAQGSTVSVVLADALLLIGVVDGAARHAEPDGSVSVAVCGGSVASLSRAGVLRLASIEGRDTFDVGRAPPGRVSCAVERSGRGLVGWVREAGADGSAPERGDAIDDGVVPPSAVGAVFGVLGVGSDGARRTWAFTTRGDGPRSVLFRAAPVCRAIFRDPYASVVYDDSEPAPPPPRVSFDCDSGVVVDDRSRW